MTPPFELYYVEMFVRYWRVRTGIRKCIKLCDVNSEHMQTLLRLDDLISSVVSDKSIKKSVIKLKKYYHIFNRLCIIFKDVKGHGKTVRDEVEKRTRRYLNEMKTRSQADSEFKKIVSRLETYWNGLFYTYEFDYIPSTNNELEASIKDFKKIWKRITGFSNVNRWINFHGPFAIYLLNFQKNKDGKSPFDLLGINHLDFITMAQKMSLEIYENERTKQLELREPYRLRLCVNQIGDREYIDNLVQEFENQVEILKGADN